ncbi:MAG: archaellin/type IV pilin N-terminal domain-containing protein [Candidatus Pacearchaeota archaeon]
MYRLHKKALSPVIATVLLIGIVIVLALIVFIWFKSFTKEAITKFGGRNVELICQDVNFDASYSNGILSVSNRGNVPIYDLKLKLEEQGRERSITLRQISEGDGSWPTNGLGAGKDFSANIGNNIGNPENLIATPILMGISSKGGERKTYVCDERRFGKEVL